MNREPHYFLAIPIPPAQRLLMKQLMEQLAARFPFQTWVHPDDTHITLHFFGNRTSMELERIVAAFSQEFQERSFPPFYLRVSHGGTFGQPEKPRILWLGLKGDLPPIHRLHARLEQRIIQLGFPHEERAYRPHITMARRFAGDRFQLEQLQHTLSKWPAIPQLEEPFLVDHFVLYQTCFDQLPMYRQLHTFELRQG